VLRRPVEPAGAFRTQGGHLATSEKGHKQTSPAHSITSSARPETGSGIVLFGQGTDPLAVTRQERIVIYNKSAGVHLRRRLELLHEVLPQAKVVALLVNPENPSLIASSLLQYSGGAGGKSAMMSRAIFLNGARVSRLELTDSAISGL
jgi:hypothetical protein